MKLDRSLQCRKHASSLIFFFIIIIIIFVKSVILMCNFIASSVMQPEEFSVIGWILFQYDLELDLNFRLLVCTSVLHEVYWAAVISDVLGSSSHVIQMVCWLSRQLSPPAPTLFTLQSIVEINTFNRHSLKTSEYSRQNITSFIHFLTL